jgi:hypothetical protein
MLTADLLTFVTFLAVRRNPTAYDRFTAAIAPNPMPEIPSKPRLFTHG